MVRWGPSRSILLLRGAGAVILATGLYAIAGLSRRRLSLNESAWRKAAWAGTGIAAVLALLTGISALRTPALTDPAFRNELPAKPGVLWDNYIELAFYNLERERYVPARDAARRAVEMRPNHYSGWWYLGVAEMRLRHQAAAQQAMQEVIRLNPQHENAKRALWALQAG
jgi:cytochrome c-type biogenesis protein CcmH/NrfG